MVAATLAARLLAGALTPLTEDEAYYRLWSLRPALGYFDHPPMIAWLIWAGRHVAGDTALGVRLVPILATALTTLATFDLARVAGLGERTAARSAVWLNATLLVGVGGLLATPDVPAALFWTATLACAVRAARGGRGAWWLAAGLAAGLACLSKYSALFLAPGILVWLLATAEGRRRLATPWPWLAILVAGAVFAPNIAWNAHHGWATFAKQFGRARFEDFAPGYVAKLAFDQALLLNPLLAIFLALAIRRRRPALLLLASAPFAIYLVVHGLHAEVQGQWPAPLYPSLAICAAAAAEGAAGRLKAVRAATPWLGFGAAAAALAFFALPSGGRPPFRDPGRELRGWPAFAAAVERARAGAGAAWVGAADYGLAAELADQPAIRAPATEVFERARFSFETPAERADFSRPGVVLVGPRDPGAAALRGCFAQVSPLPELDRGLGRGMTRYQAFRVAGPLRDVERAGCETPAS